MYDAVVTIELPLSVSVGLWSLQNSTVGLNSRWLCYRQMCHSFGLDIWNPCEVWIKESQPPAW